MIFLVFNYVANMLACLHPTYAEEVSLICLGLCRNLYLVSTKY